MLVDHLKVHKFNEAGPYYSSYPTLSEWNQSISSEDYSAALKTIADQHPKASLYIHFPFCHKQCLYCACNAVITSDEKLIMQFQDSLLVELDMLFDTLADKGDPFAITEIHLGGGSPSMLTDHAFEGLVDRVFGKIKRDGLKSFCIEIDPRTATQEKLILYKNSGITRLSFGVQEFSPDVQRVINRVQPFELMQSLLTDSMRKDFPSVNFDILYGLPLQTRQSFMQTVQKVIELAPDRITLIRYAHIPESRSHQRALNKYPMPDDAEKTSMFFDATQAFKDAGWEHVGIDHFARPDDSLALAARNGIMTRNFGGYNATDIDTMIGIGPTATMRVGNLYAQNTYSLEEYRQCLLGGRFPVKRGYRLGKDDFLRREIIDSILCRYRLDFNAVEIKYGIVFPKYFANELQKLQSMVGEGIVVMSQQGLRVTAEGRFFLRNICNIFDKFLQNGKQYIVNGP